MSDGKSRTLPGVKFTANLTGEVRSVTYSVPEEAAHAPMSKHEEARAIAREHMRRAAIGDRINLSSHELDAVCGAVLDLTSDLRDTLIATVQAYASGERTDNESVMRAAANMLKDGLAPNWSEYYRADGSIQPEVRLPAFSVEQKPIDTRHVALTPHGLELGGIGPDEPSLPPPIAAKLLELAKSAGFTTLVSLARAMDVAPKTVERAANGQGSYKFGRRLRTFLIERGVGGASAISLDLNEALRAGRVPDSSTGRWHYSEGMRSLVVATDETCAVTRFPTPDELRVAAARLNDHEGELAKIRAELEEIRDARDQHAEVIGMLSRQAIEDPERERDEGLDHDYLSNGDTPTINRGHRNGCNICGRPRSEHRS